MRIVAMSDMHGRLPEKVEPCDLLILGGDIAPFHDHSLVFQRSWFETNFRVWLMDIPCDHVVMIAGNHDFIFQENIYFGNRLAELCDKLIYLENSMTIINDKVIWGSPYAPQHQLMNWAFLTNELQLERMYEDIPSDVDILISHGPAYGVGDSIPAPEVGKPHKRMYLGSTSLRKAIKEKQPKVFFCGHIHEGWGAYKIGDTLVYNVSIMDEKYEPNNAPRVINM